MSFPDAFTANLIKFYGEQTTELLLNGLQGQPVVSVRRNPSKISEQDFVRHFQSKDRIEWCCDGLYLNERPNFTLDPLLHSGAYYVQEASSMYIGHLLDDIIGNKPLRILDLCAAPGGKTTHTLSKISPDDILVSNEVIRPRASILAENCAKWGQPNVIVTNNDPADFKILKGYFDIIIVDAPCSGEGMFRKDSNAINEWSEDNVALCASRQRRILSDIWGALACGGHLIYSTCTFNNYENSENVDWICTCLGGTLIEKRQFLPGIDRGEGFFCALIKKESASEKFSLGKIKVKPTLSQFKTLDFVKDGYTLISKGELIKAYPTALLNEMVAVESLLRPVHSAVAVATVKGKDVIPEADLALSTIRRNSFVEVDLPKEDAVRFLSKESLLFTDKPKGYLLMTYQGFPLGFVKNLGNRSNNLHPAARRIRNSANINK